jgi:hypothetical protein
MKERKPRCGKRRKTSGADDIHAGNQRKGISCRESKRKREEVYRKQILEPGFLNLPQWNNKDKGIPP